MLIQSLLINLAVYILIGTSNTALADGPGWSGLRTVTEVVNTNGGGINVRLSPDLNGCVSQSGYGSHYASIYPNNIGINRINADLLTAYVTGGKVALYFNDSNCTVLETIITP